MFVSEVLPGLVCVQQTEWKVSGINTLILFPNTTLQISVLLNTIFTQNPQSTWSPFPSFRLVTLRSELLETFQVLLLSPTGIRPRPTKRNWMMSKRCSRHHQQFLGPDVQLWWFIIHFWIRHSTKFIIFDCWRETRVSRGWSTTMPTHMFKVACVEAKALSLSFQLLLFSPHSWTHFFSSDNLVLMHFLFNTSPMIVLRAPDPKKTG